MILNDPTGRPYTAGIGGRATLDDLFRRAVARRPNAIALIDPPNRESFTDGAPRQLTYAQADRMVSAIAARLCRIGLHTDAIVALQLTNTVESVLTLLGVLRAGLIAMPLLLLWRRADAITALSRVGANALIVSGRVGRVDHFDLALQVAAEIFSVRYVCGYGLNPPDGLVSLDDLYTLEKLDPVPSLDRDPALPPGPGAHLAAITWDLSADGLVPVGRSHGELIAGGLATLLEGRFEQDAVTLSTLTLSSFAGLAVTVLPWLLVGGTLALHHPFDPDAFAAQCKSMRYDAIILPGPLVPQFVESGHLAGAHGLKNVIGVWRAPERLSRAPVWRDPSIGMMDVQVFGETALIATRRGQDGKPATVTFGALAAPRGSKRAIIVGEVQPTARGTVALRGHMVPRCAFPPSAERTALPHLHVAADGFVDTGYACLSGPDTTALSVTGPPPGVVSVGGYRFLIRALQDTVGQIEGGATLVALPDAFSGHRLAGSAADRDAVAATLGKLGVNPLVVGAFRDRRRPAA